MAAIGVQLVKYVLHLPGRSARPRRGALLLVSGLSAAVLGTAGAAAAAG
jgi:hypothetical protein